MNVLGKVQIRLCLVLYRPISDLVKILASMCRLHTSQHLLLLLTPLPEYRADVR